MTSKSFQTKIELKRFLANAEYLELTIICLSMQEVHFMKEMKETKNNNDVKTMEENHISHVIIPSKNFQRSKIFFEEVFGWKLEEQPEKSSLDVLPLSRKGPSAELNSEVEVIIPSIKTSNIEAKLRLIEEFGGKKLKDKTPIDKDAEQGYYASFEDPQGNRMCLYSEK